MPIFLLRNSAFTLIEVLVALILIAVAAGTVSVAAGRIWAKQTDLAIEESLRRHGFWLRSAVEGRGGELRTWPDRMEVVPHGTDPAWQPADWRANAQQLGLGSRRLRWSDGDGQPCTLWRLDAFGRSADIHLAIEGADGFTQARWQWLGISGQWVRR